MLNLAEYLTVPEEELSSEKLEKIDSQLEIMAKGIFGFEKNAQYILKKQRIDVSYPKISVKFLRMSQDYPVKTDEGKDVTIKIPKFGVYSLNNSSMIINIRRSYNDGPEFLLQIESPKMPMGIMSELVKSTELFSDLSTLYHYGEDSQTFTRSRGIILGTLPKEIKMKYEKIGDKILKNSFVGLIPDKARKEIKEAQKLFDNNIFFIVETNVKDWNVEKYIHPDPFVIGSFGGEEYYITQFDTTPLEEFVSRRFLEK